MNRYITIVAEVVDPVTASVFWESMGRKEPVSGLRMVVIASGDQYTVPNEIVQEILETDVHKLLSAIVSKADKHQQQERYG